MKDLFKILPKLLVEFDKKNEVREAIVFAAWKRIVGKSLSENTAPVRLDKKRLVVAVSDKIWKHHMKSLTSQIIFKLNSTLEQPAVTFIEFRINEKKVQASRKDLSETHSFHKEFETISLEDIPPKLRRSAAYIKDVDLRHKFLLAAGSCLVRMKRSLKNKAVLF